MGAGSTVMSLVMFVFLIALGMAFYEIFGGQKPGQGPWPSSKWRRKGGPNPPIRPME